MKLRPPLAWNCKQGLPTVTAVKSFGKAFTLSRRVQETKTELKMPKALRKKIHTKQQRLTDLQQIVGIVSEASALETNG